MPESKVHSFIVKLLMDEDETGQTKWHGYVTHVPDGARRYVRDLRDIVNFIESYLADGVAGKPKVAQRPRWLKWPGRKR